MIITAITKFKHGALWSALKKLHWSQKDLCLKCGINYSTMNAILNLKLRPTEDQANTIQRVLGECGVYLDPIQEWPESFKGFPTRIKIEQTRDFSALDLEIAQTYYNQLTISEVSEREDIMMESMSVLTEQELKVLEMRFGLNGHPMSYAEIARHFNKCRERPRQIEIKALRKLRNEMDDSTRNRRNLLKTISLPPADSPSSASEKSPVP